MDTIYSAVNLTAEQRGELSILIGAYASACELVGLRTAASDPTDLDWARENARATRTELIHFVNHELGGVR